MMLEIALHYARNRWPVFPLNGKMPAISKARGGHGCLDATLEPKLIENWWLEYPAANVGIATGCRSGLLVIDVDPRKTSDWLASVNALEMPQTFTVRTASGGFHLYFTLPSNSKISIGTNLLPGIDWRGNGGYVVGAGSTVNGVMYQIIRQCGIVPAPTSLLERLDAHRKGPRVAARNDSGQMVIPDGKRNEQMFRIGCALRRYGIDFNAINEALRAVNSDHCEPLLTADELRAIVSSAMRYVPDARAMDGA